MDFSRLDTLADTGAAPPLAESGAIPAPAPAPQQPPPASSPPRAAPAAYAHTQDPTFTAEPDLKVAKWQRAFKSPEQWTKAIEYAKKRRLLETAGVFGVSIIVLYAMRPPMVCDTDGVGDDIDRERCSFIKLCFWSAIAAVVFYVLMRNWDPESGT
jgi:hypothetical protein